MSQTQDWKVVQQHYGDNDIAGRIIDRLRSAGRDLDVLTRDDTATFDEFHGGGRSSTLALAAFAEIEPSQHVLDIGSGIGGPARTLVAEHGCIVTGLELTAEFIRAADMLNGLLGMTDDVDLIQGSATNIPTRALAFDLVWSQNMLMNVKDKAQLFREVFRVTKPGGKFAFETVIAGEGGAPHLPTFWAARPDQNFLTKAHEIGQLAIDAGFIELAFEDTTDVVIANGRKRVAAMHANNTDELGLDVIVTSAVAKKMENSICNNLEGRTGAIRALFQRPDR